MSDVNITFTPGRNETEHNYIVIWSGNATEDDLYKIMKDHNLPNLSNCDIGLRSDEGNPSLKFTNNDPNLIPDHITCFNGCEIHLTIPVECIRQDRYRTIYSFKGDPFANTNIVQKVTEPTTKKGVCPWCHSNKVQYTDIFHYDDEDKDEIEKKCLCEACGRHFTEVYRGTYLYTTKE